MKVGDLARVVAPIDEIPLALGTVVRITKIDWIQKDSYCFEVIFGGPLKYTWAYKKELELLE